MSKYDEAFSDSNEMTLYSITIESENGEKIVINPVVAHYTRLIVDYLEELLK